MTAATLFYNYTWDIQTLTTINWPGKPWFFHCSAALGAFRGLHCPSMATRHEIVNPSKRELTAEEFKQGKVKFSIIAKIS
jgi:hypothetical protein